MFLLLFFFNQVQMSLGGCSKNAKGTCQEVIQSSSSDSNVAAEMLSES